jgi:uncharacterized membrane protein
VLKTLAQIFALVAFLINFALAQSTDGCTFTRVQIQQETTYVYSINDSNTIVGEFLPLSTPTCHSEAGFILKNGNVTCLVWPGSYLTSANAINDGGVVAGAYTLYVFGSQQGFVWNKGKFTNLTYPGSILTAATGINAQGFVVGSYQDSQGIFHGFLYSGGHYSSIDYPGAQSTQATQINKLGAIVGSYTDSSGAAHGFIKQSGQYTVIDYPGAANTSPSGVNDYGVVVGAYYNSDFSQWTGFAWKNGDFRSISNPADPTQTTVNGINSTGVLVGSLGNSNGGYKATGCMLP